MATDIVENEDEAVALCRLANRDPDEQITRFVMLDFANVLVGMEDLTDEQRLTIMKGADASQLADSLCDVSHWDEIFQTRAELDLYDLEHPKAVDTSSLRRAHGAGGHYDKRIWAGLGCPNCIQELAARGETPETREEALARAERENAESDRDSQAVAQEHREGKHAGADGRAHGLLMGCHLCDEDEVRDEEGLAGR